jgi:lipoprotein-anchoring transpeptidase ErfK/SrfK
MAGRRHIRAWQWIAAFVVAAAAAAGVVGFAANALTPARADGARAGRAEAAATASATTPPAQPSEPGQPSGSTEPSEPAKPPASSSAPPPPACPQGDRQRDVEAALHQLGDFGPVTVDGQQSTGDCAAIKKFQARYGIRPAVGQAGAATADIARRIVATSTAAEQAKCTAQGSSLTICVDLTQQTAWAVRAGAVVWGPTTIRTGKPGFATRTGTYSIFNRNTREWSDPYKVWMPYWQAFNGGIGFHETTTYLHNGAIGSHGCVNLLHSDAVALWNLAKIGTAVHVFGRRPGT